jgi:hypothetical protein
VLRIVPDSFLESECAQSVLIVNCFCLNRKSHEFDFGIYYVILKLFYHHKMAREVMPFTEIVREVKVLKQE